MGILEIVLTITAYRKGWKAVALIPVAVTMVLGFLSGLAVKAGGGSAHGAAPAFFLGDIICVVVLAVLTARGPKSHTVSNAQNGPASIRPKEA